MDYLSIYLDISQLWLFNLKIRKIILFSVSLKDTFELPPICAFKLFREKWLSNGKLEVFSVNRKIAFEYKVNPFLIENKNNSDV